MSEIAFNAEEQAINEHILAAMHGIQALGLREDTSNLQVELSVAVHTFQMFLIKHMLERLGQDSRWSRWFTERKEAVPWRAGDWTVDPETGISNSSVAYLKIVDVVAELIRAEFTVLDPALVRRSARMIVSQLANRHGLEPRS